MDTSNLKAGMEFKSYKDTCLFLNEKIKGGESKKYQLKEWKRFFDFHKNGNKIVIDKVYDTPLKKEDGRMSGNNSLYGKYIQKLILDLLSQDENKGQVFLSCNQLLRKLQMVGANYSKGKKDIPRLSEILKIDEAIVKDVYEYTHNKLKGALESSLNSLVKQCWINYNIKKTVCINKVTIELNALGEIKLVDGVPNYTVEKVYREATIEEQQAIIKHESIIMDSINCKDKQEVIIKGLMETFRNSVNKLLQKECNIEFYYDSYEIISHKDTLIERLGRFEKKGAFDDLNNLIIEQTYNTIEKKHLNAVDKINSNSYKESFYKDDRLNIRADDDYVCKSKLLTDKIIPRQARKIKGLE